MKPPILAIGKVFERDGVTHVENWAFGMREDEDPAERRCWKPGDSAEQLMELLMAMRDGPTDPDSCWSVEELREIAEQEAVLTLLPTTEDQ